MNPVTSKHLRGFKIKQANDNVVDVKDAYAEGFIKACADAQVESEIVMEVIETLDIHL